MYISPSVGREETRICHLFINFCRYHKKKIRLRAYSPFFFSFHQVCMRKRERRGGALRMLMAAASGPASGSATSLCCLCWLPAAVIGTVADCRRRWLAGPITGSVGDRPCQYSVWCRRRRSSPALPLSTSLSSSPSSSSSFIVITIICRCHRHHHSSSSSSSSFIVVIIHRSSSSSFIIIIHRHHPHPHPRTRYASTVLVRHALCWSRCSARRNQKVPAQWFEKDPLDVKRTYFPNLELCSDDHVIKRTLTHTRNYISIYLLSI